MSKTLIVDNGAYSMKCGYSTDESARIIPNCIIKAKSERKRVYIGDEIDDCRDHSSLFFLLPAEKGYIVNWDVEQKVWDRAWSSDVLDVKFSETRLVLTDPIYNVPAIKDNSYEILFEHYLFASVAKTSVTATTLAAMADENLKHCYLVVDSGFSFTHIVPYFNGSPIREGITRIDIGGKALTNLLKEWISYRQLNVLEETFVMNECKEDVCYVADDFNKHLKNTLKRGTENTVIREYLLPDFVTHSRGFINHRDMQLTDDHQKLVMNAERFTVPEVLFNPSDIGVNQMGIPEAIAYSVKRCPKVLHSMLYNNIILIGGNALFAGFRKRIETELRSLANDLFPIRFHNVSNPITHAWQTGCFAVNSSSRILEKKFVTKKEYDEQGCGVCIRRYYDFMNSANFE